MAEVTIRCPCPGLPHADGDTIYLREKLDYRSAATIKYALVMERTDNPDGGVPEIMAVMSEQYIYHGVEAWTLVDEKGETLPVTKANIRDRLLPVPDAMLVGEKADELYAEAVMLPLGRMGETSSPPTPTNGSTSAMNGSSPELPKRSKRSSTTTSPTDDTETTSSSPDGVSRSSPSSVSASG